MLLPDISTIQLRLKQEEGKTKVFEKKKKKWLILTPEEHIRQYVLQYMVSNLQYPVSLISVEKKIVVAGMAKRFDIIVYDRKHNPWMLVECKSPEVALSNDTLFQLLQYHNAIPCRYWVVINGHQGFCADAQDVFNVTWQDVLPAYDS